MNQSLELQKMSLSKKDKQRNKWTVICISTHKIDKKCGKKKATQNKKDKS